MIHPIDYYKLYDDASIAYSLSEVKRNIEAIEAFAEQQNYRVFWRGQANYEWGLVSSLVRRLMASGPVDDTLLNRVEDRLLQEASAWIKDLQQPDYRHPLAKLAYLQHHKVPTRLIDFTSSPWMAVFFAAEAYDNIDGRVFALLVKDEEVLNQTPEKTPWRKYRTSEIKIYDAVAAGISFPRLEVQKGVLALGRLPSTTPYREVYDEILNEDNKKRKVLAEEIRRILSIPFKLNPFEPTEDKNSISRRAKPPIGVTFRIHVDKVSIRRDLASKPGRTISPREQKITHQAVYPDVEGMVSHSKTLLELEKGVLLI